MEAIIARNEPLARHTTFRIGGPAEYFVRASSRDELIQAAHWARERHIEVLLLGNGSNILASDAGVRGLVIENHADEIVEREIGESDNHEQREGKNHESGERLQVVADSGASLPGLANRLARKGWRGLEWAIGVPATVGAAVVTNAGAHGGAVSDNLVRAEMIDAQSRVRWWTHDELHFAYRTSFVKQHSNEFVVLRAEFALERDDAANCIARMNRYKEHRRKSQPTEPSVGSMFKNPPGDYAGRLIEAAGLKGQRVGNVQVSDVHANFFVNLGGATASEVMQLVEAVTKTVREKYDVELELEIQLVGAW